MFVVYHGPGEVLVTTTKKEKDMLKEWFGNNSLDRNKDDYDRVEINEKCVRVKAHLTIR